MEFSGEDKRIRALFCELKREEKETSQLFATTWNSAEAEFHRRGFSRLRLRSRANLVRFATAILVVSLILAATTLPKYLRRQPGHDNATQAAAAGSSATFEEPRPSEKVPANRDSGTPPERLVAIRRSVHVRKSPVTLARGSRSVKQNALSEWQSPTATLLRSTGDELLRFVPPMNESAQEMKKFLANDLN